MPLDDPASGPISDAQDTVSAVSCTDLVADPPGSYQAHLKASVVSMGEHLFVADIRERVAELTAEGLTLNEVAHRLGVARSTVGYHVDVLRRSRDPARRERTGSTRPAAGPTVTRRRVGRLLSEGMMPAQVAESLDLARSTVTFHARELGYRIEAKFGQRYDWQTVREFYERGHSVAACRATFGFSRARWYEAVRRGLITPRPGRIPLDQLLVPGTRRNRNHVKQRLYDAGLKARRCETCGAEEWNDRPIPLALHHVNGDREDNRLENLQILCPNCHSQTGTWAGRNGRQAPGEGAAKRERASRTPGRR